MTSTFTRFCCAMSLAVAAPAFAGQAAPAKPPAQPQSPPQAAAPAPAPAVVFSYSSEGRRDPFVSLANRGADGRSVANRPPGLAGVLIDEVQIKGIVKDQAGYTALVQGSDNKVYRVRSGDRLMDGVVKAITPEDVVFSQDVNDPLIVQKQREIRKSLRPGEGSRG